MRTPAAKGRATPENCHKPILAEKMPILLKGRYANWQRQCLLRARQSGALPLVGFSVRMKESVRRHVSKLPNPEIVSLSWGTACRGCNERSVLTGCPLVYATSPCGSSSRISLRRQSFSVSRPRLRPPGNIHNRSRLLLTSKTRPRFAATSFDDFAIAVPHCSAPPKHRIICTIL